MRFTKKLSFLLLISSILSAAITTPAAAAPAALGPAVQVDVNCGTLAVPAPCTASSLSASNTTRKLAVTSSGEIFALFHGPEGIRVVKSLDRGQTFGVATQISPDNYQAEIAASSNDRLYVVWTDGTDILVSISANLGNTWSAPTRVGTLAVGSLYTTIHMAVDGEFIYLVSNSGNDFWTSNDAGTTFVKSLIDFGSFAVGGQWAYSDVLVDPLNHDVYVFVDDPTVSWFKSTDKGQTFGGEVETNKDVYYSVAAISVSTTAKYMYMSGGDIFRTGLDNLEQVDLLDLSAQVTRQVDPSDGEVQGRSLAADGYGNVVAGAIRERLDVSSNVIRDITFRVSNDFGSSFGTTQNVISTTSTFTWANAAINQTNGDTMYLYQDGDDIYFITYQGYLVGYDLELSVTSISLGFAGEVKTLILTNSGTTAITLSNLGLDNNIFSQTSTCGNTLTIGATCTISVTGSTPGDAVLQVTASNGTNTVTKNIPVSLGALAASGGLAPNPPSVSSSGGLNPVPILDLFRGSFPAKKAIKLRGSNLDQISTLTLNGFPANILRKSAGEIEIQLDQKLALGEVIAVMGSHTQSGALFNVTNTSKASISGFAPGSSKLTQSLKARLKKLVTGKSAAAIVCTGFTEGPKVLKGDAELARARAAVACDVARRENPEATITLRVRTTSNVGAEFRRAEILITD